ncbi:hypothetical protein IMZ48_25830 [Candidatus Bathyarchaeota archaeon]|nr:hypothetical protein [Candidatus Bathyarchaeota archaeon]
MAPVPGSDTSSIGHSGGRRMQRRDGQTRRQLVSFQNRGGSGGGVVPAGGRKLRCDGKVAMDIMDHAAMPYICLKGVLHLGPFISRRTSSEDVSRGFSSPVSVGLADERVVGNPPLGWHSSLFVSSAWTHETMV